LLHQPSAQPRALAMNQSVRCPAAGATNNTSRPESGNRSRLLEASLGNRSALIQRHQSRRRARGTSHLKSLAGGVLFVLGSMGARSLIQAIKPSPAEQWAQEQKAKRLNEAANVPRPKLPPRVAALYEQATQGLKDDPKFVRFIQDEMKRVADGVPNAGQPKNKDNVISDQGFGGLGAELTSLGTMRLPPHEFQETVKLKLKLAQQSSKVCAGFWSAGLSLADMALALDGLSDSELRRWFDLSNRAMHLQLHATDPLPRIKGETVVQGMTSIVEGLPKDEGEALLRIAEAGTAVSPDDGCKAFKQFIEGGLRLPDNVRDPFLRGMSSPSLVDW
jgi:hypothetical protein